MVFLIVVVIVCRLFVFWFWVVLCFLIYSDVGVFVFVYGLLYCSSLGL